MAARKLQTEIDRTLKKVGEGVELFENIYDKMQSSTNQTQKEKSELDLKSQIKKLQRLRDQIKTWVASNDIKDKSILMENRRLIETQMEKFKACEKEMKTKAFSKEGLIQAAKLDPKEQEKEEAIQWVNHQVEELQMQVEQTEAEIEALQGTGKKRNKGGQSNAGRQEELEHLNDRRKWHISRLEIVLRMLNNGSLPLEKVNGLKEDVVYFVESNTEEDFEEDEGIYDELNLDEEEEKFGLLADENDSGSSDEESEDVPSRPTKKHDEESVSSSKRDESPILKKASVSLSLRKQSVESKPPPPSISLSQQPMSTILKAGLSQPAPRPSAPAVLPPIRYAAAAAAAVAPQPSTSSSSVAQPPAPSTPAASSTSHPPPAQPVAPSIPPTPSGALLEQQNIATSSPSLTQLSMTSPMLSSAASASQQPDGSFYSGQESPAMSEAVSNGKAVPQSPRESTLRKSALSSPALATSSPTIPKAPDATQQASAQTPANGSHPLQPQGPPMSGPSPLPQQLQQGVQRPKSPQPAASQQPQQPQQTPMFPPGVKIPPTEQSATPSQAPQNIGSQRPTSTSQSVPQHRAAAAFPGSLSDLVVSFENVKQKALRANNLDQVHKMLEGGYQTAPQPQDTEKPKYYVPRNPYQTAPYYPQAPHPLLQTPAIFAQLDVETLFWVFYYLPGTYQQYLAAKELKRQSWRFHVKYLTWFQRHSEPQAITEEYEQGVYVYFDWEGSWCQRKKSDFRFEYRYLSED